MYVPRLSDTVVGLLLHIFAHFSLDLEDLLIAIFYFVRCRVDMLLAYALHIFHTSSPFICILSIKSIVYKSHVTISIVSYNMVSEKQ